MELSQLVIPWGQSAKLTCEVRGNPPPSVLWLRNAVPLTSSQRLRLSRRALRVVSMGPEDEGVYQCMAENEVGSAHAVVQLKTARPGECNPRHWDTSWPLRGLQEATGRGQRERNCVYRWGFFSVSLQVCSMKFGIW